MNHLRCLLAGAACLLVACDPTKVAEQCVQADLVAQCPVGSNPILGAQAQSACGGSFDANLVTENGSATGQCSAAGSCEFLCQFEVPCTCGVATLTKESIVCAECPDQSCGDGRCDGTERGACEPGQQGCVVCAEDCTGPTCGDGDCTGSESPETCPQDCAATCVPNESICIGTSVSKCAADGHTSVAVDCAGFGQACANGACVAPDVCGNGICDGAETPASCAGDCSTLCQPSSRSCAGNILVVCAADGQSTAETDCGTQICVNGQCRLPNVCGNGACEANESGTCAEDCAAVCGNKVCENNEATACPADCTNCGNATCESGEITSCPQDCGICVPSGKQCLARTLRVCNANGTAYDDIDCDDLGLTCGGGNCVEPGICGNGLCESAESQATCLADCAETCGNGTCAGSESFLTCALDCDPICGDGTCEGNEASTTCSFDCLASCGDGECKAPEARANCPRDCGSCGDGLCQDGYESASLNPPGLLEACIVDCVVTGCTVDANCDDDVACTNNQCLNGSCIYTPSDDLCTGDDKCIRFNGCCPDADRDGYADEACGGSDCNDQDGTVHPGALEVCGGGDKNCNHEHKPALLPAKKLTASAAYKRDMTAIDLGGSFLLGWTGKPAIEQHLQLVEVGWDLLPKGEVQTSNDIAVNDAFPHVSLVWNPTRQKLGAWWMLPDNPVTDFSHGTGWSAKVGWLDIDGTLAGEPQLVSTFFCLQSNGYRSTMALSGLAFGDSIVFSVGGFTFGMPYPAVVSGGFWELAATGNAQMKWGTTCGAPTGAVRMISHGGLLSGLSFRYPDVFGSQEIPRSGPPFPGNIMSLDPSGVGPPTEAATDHASAAGACAMGTDGELLAMACATGNKVYYNRVTQGGGVFYTAEVLSGAHVPIAVGSSKPRPNTTPMVGVALRDGANNLWFFVRDSLGDKVLDPAIIAGGDTIASAWVLHDGTDFVVVWLAKTGGFEQAFAQRVTCE